MQMLNWRNELIKKNSCLIYAAPCVSAKYLQLYMSAYVYMYVYRRLLLVGCLPGYTSILYVCVYVCIVVLMVCTTNLDTLNCVSLEIYGPTLLELQCILENDKTPTTPIHHD